MTAGIWIGAFEPFGGRTRNRALDVARLITDEPTVLPVAFTELPRVVNRLVRQAHRAGARGVLLLGESRLHRTVRVEQVARNRIDARIADNRGRQPRGCAVIDGGSPLLHATAPTAAFLQTLRRQALPARLSRDAGSFACNAAFYNALCSAACSAAPAASAHSLEVAFVHIPAAPASPPVRVIATALSAAISDWASAPLPLPERSISRPSPGFAKI
jgi:pyroglutamyl-peptidase